MTADRTSNFFTTSTMITIAVAFVVLAVSFAARAVIGLGMQIWSADLGWSRSQISAIGSIALVTMAVTVPLAGLAADRIGGRLVLLIGCLCLASGLGLVSVMSAFPHFAVGYGLLCGAGFGLVSLPVVGSLVVRHVRTRQGLATGIATAGSTGGQLLILPALAALFPVLGWRSGLAIVAVLAAFVGLGAYLVVPRHVQEIQRHGGAQESCEAGRSLPVTAFRSRAFLGLFLSFALCGFTATGVVETHLIPFAQICGFSTLASASAYSLFALFNLIGMVLSGVIADRVDRQFLLVSIFVVRGSAFIVPVFVGGDYATLLIFAVIVGVAFYATFPPTIGLCAAHFGKENLGLVMGVLTVGHSIGAAVGAWFGGFIYDIFLRYDVMWYGAAILAFSSATFALLVSDPRSDGGPRRTTLRVLIPTSNRENLQMQQP